VEPIYIQAEQSRLPEMKTRDLGHRQPRGHDAHRGESLTALLAGLQTIPPPVAEEPPPAQQPPTDGQPQREREREPVCWNGTRAYNREMDTLEEDLRACWNSMEGGQQGVPPPHHNPD
jgi:hypothetical protein